VTLSYTALRVAFTVTVACVFMTCSFDSGFSARSWSGKIDSFNAGRRYVRDTYRVAPRGSTEGRTVNVTI